MGKTQASSAGKDRRGAMPAQTRRGSARRETADRKKAGGASAKRNEDSAPADSRPRPTGKAGAAGAAALARDKAVSDSGRTAALKETNGVGVEADAGDRTDSRRHRIIEEVPVDHRERAPDALAPGPKPDERPRLRFTPSAVEKALIGLSPDDDLEAVLRDRGEYADRAVDFLQRAREYFEARPEMARRFEEEVLATWPEAKKRRMAFLSALHDLRTVLTATVMAPVRRAMTDQAVNSHLDELSRYLAAGPRDQASG